MNIFPEKLVKCIVALFLLISVSSNAQNIDIRILRSLNSPDNLPSDGFFKFVSNSDAYVVVGIPAVIAVAGLIKKNDQPLRKAYVSFAAVVISSGVTQVLKYTVNRDRPFVTYPDIVKKSTGGSPSFPSGHTSSAFALATSVTLSYPKWYIAAPFYAWAGTVAYSRMDLGVHYPSDVIAGALVGAGSAWLTHFINKKLTKKPWQKSCDCQKY